jgi:acetyl esterase/lipase
MVQREPLLVLAKHYLGGADPKTPQASPLFAELRGLPPLLIQVGSAETLLDDSTHLAERARKAGVEVELEVWPDMIHVWHAFAALLPEGREGIERIGQYLRKRLG